MKDEAGFAVEMVVIPVGVSEGLVDAVSVDGAHQCLNAHGGFASLRRRVRPGCEPAAVVEAAEDSEVGDGARTKVKAGAGNDLGDDGVVDVDVKCGSAHRSGLRDSLPI